MNPDQRLEEIAQQVDDAWRDELSISVMVELRAIAADLRAEQERAGEVKAACERLVNNPEPSFKYLVSKKDGRIDGNWLQWETMRATGESLLRLWADALDGGGQDGAAPDVPEVAPLGDENSPAAGSTPQPPARPCRCGIDGPKGEHDQAVALDSAKYPTLAHTTGPVCPGYESKEEQ